MSHVADRTSPSSEARKRRRTGQSTGPVQSRTRPDNITPTTDNPLLAELESRAREGVYERRRICPTATSVETAADVYGTEIRLEMNRLMIQDVQSNLERHYGECSVCYAIEGLSETDHESGVHCRIPLAESTPGWYDFKAMLHFQRGIMCFGCLLTTVWASPAGF